MMSLASFATLLSDGPARLNSSQPGGREKSGYLRIIEERGKEHVHSFAAYCDRERRACLFCPFEKHPGMDQSPLRCCRDLGRWLDIRHLSRNTSLSQPTFVPHCALYLCHGRDCRIHALASF